MSWIHDVLAFFGIHRKPPHEELKAALSAKPANDNAKRYVNRAWMNEPISLNAPTRFITAAEAAEVDNLTERYSAARYVQHLKAAMDGDRTGFAEWSRHIHSLGEDDYRVFFFEVDELIEAGALVHVLTEEEMAAVRQRVLDNVEEYRLKAQGPAMPIDPAFVNAIVNDPDAEIELEMDESEAEAWLEDIDDADIGGEPGPVEKHMEWLANQREQSSARLTEERAAWPLTPEEAAQLKEGDTHGQEDDEEAREGQEDEEQGRSDEEGRVLT